MLVKKYLSCGDEVYGYVVGDALRREVGLPAQDDSVIEIVTNREKSRCRSIGAHAGYRDVVLRASRVKVRAGNVDALRALDLLTALDLQALIDADRARLSTFLSRVPRRLPPSQRALLPRENLQEAARSRGFGPSGLKPLDRGWDAGASPAGVRRLGRDVAI